MNEPWTEDAVRALGVRTDVPTAGSVLGIGRTHAYELAARGEFPVPVIRVGEGRYVVPVRPLLQLLLLEDLAPSTDRGEGEGPVPAGPLAHHHGHDQSGATRHEHDHEDGTPIRSLRRTA